MATYQSTNMAELIADVASLIKAEVKSTGDLPSVRKVSTEPLVNPAAFPFITVTPISETLKGYRGDKLYNVRRIRIEMVAKKRDSKSALRQALGMSDKVQAIFKVNSNSWLIPDRATAATDTAMDTQIIEIESSNNNAPFRNGFMHISALELEIHSFDKMFTSDYAKGVQERAATTSSTDTKTLIDKITSLIKTAKLASPLIQDVKSLKSFTLPPQPIYPVVFVSIENESREHAFAGQDSINRTVGINIFTKIKSRKKSLDRNVDLADRLRQLVMMNPNISGTCYSTDYIGTSYGQLTGGNDLLFGTQVLFNTYSYGSLHTS